MSVRQHYHKHYGIILKTPKQVAGIRRACQFATILLDKLSERIKPGITTLQLDAHAREIYSAAGARSATLGYGDPPFPASICTSVNEVICHGIPDNRTLVEGDLLNVDVSPILDGYVGDCSRMYQIGEVDQDKALVNSVAYDCLVAAIAIVKPKALLSDIGKVIENHASKHDCSVVHQYGGHGVGLHFHESPHVRHYRNNFDIPLVTGMTFTIEPMINRGVSEAINEGPWIARTADKKPSAQWEHTVLVTEDGCEVLTESSNT